VKLGGAGLPRELHTESVSTPTGPTRAARTFARLSWWMLAIFALWTGVVILTSEPIARLVFGFTPDRPGDTFYLEAWGPWIAVTLAWLAPVIAGIVLAVIACVRGAGKLAWAALAVHSFLLLAITVPNVIERLIIL